MNKDNLTVNAIRFLSVDAIQKANSGHPGLPLGAAPMSYALWGNHLNINPKDSNWFNRDRFILSAGHGSAMLYALLHLYGFDVTIDDIKDFRQLNSRTPGHPELGYTDGVESSTGPLGQGISMAVGLAMAEEHLAAKYNKEDAKLIDHYTYSLCGDGDLMEGIGYEACSLAGTLGLGKLIVLYDSNSISIEGNTDIAFTEDIVKRFEGFNWQVIEVEDGNDIAKISEAIEKAKLEMNKPTLIKITTVIGYGSPKANQAASHGSPLGDDNLTITRNELNWNYEPFVVPEEVYANTSEQLAEKEAVYTEWKQLESEYSNKYSEDYKQLMNDINGVLPENLFDEEYFTFDKDLASRAASGICLNRIAEKVNNLFGGSADLGPSNQTELKNSNWFSKENRDGKNIHFGVREHAMAAIANGLKLHGGLHPYVATFLVFSDYMKGAIRLSSIMKLSVTYVLTHDSIGVGEDGPTHQPIEHLAMLRSTPNLVTFRPADAKETAVGWKIAMESKDTPIAMALSRQTLPNLKGSSLDAEKGGYIIAEEIGELDLILLSSGSEVSLAVKAKEVLEKDGYGVRVVSMPSMEIFDKQTKEYKDSVLPREVRNRVSIEAASTFGWGKYVGLDGISIGIDSFGASGPGNDVYEYFKITCDELVTKSKELLNNNNK
ncbi:MAG: transketolase [Tissierellia bacterium]|nr:transketolase [Tissierellia bacterium]